MRSEHPSVAEARRLADEVLFPAASAADAAGELPPANLDALAAAGFYGLFAPAEVGGAGADFATVAEVVETLASGCLATTFVLVQHFGLLRSLLLGSEPLAAPWLGPMCRGERRAGIVFAGMLPGPARVNAAPLGGGAWRIDGTAPWVSGWGHVDVLQVAARGPDETVVYAAIDAVDAAGLSVERQRLVALDATSTVRATFDGVIVQPDRVLRVTPFDPSASGGASLRLNGSLALGLIRRCCALLGPGPLDEELDRCRDALDAADGHAMPAARAAASELAWRASAAAAVTEGSASIGVGHHSSRLAREALFLLVSGSRPEIKAALLASLGAAT